MQGQKTNQNKPTSQQQVKTLTVLPTFWVAPSVQLVAVVLSQSTAGWKD